MATLTSVHNEKVRFFLSLRERKARLACGQYAVEGEKMVEEALTWAHVTCLLVQEGRQAQYAGLIARAQALSIEMMTAADHVFDKVSEARTPQGVLASVALPPQADLARMGERLVILDGVQDPGNVGAILRAAEAAGASGAVLSEACADAYGSKALRATMGSIFRMPLLRSEELGAIVGELRARGWSVLASELDGEPFERGAGAIKPPWALLIGSEAHGVSKTLSG
ncbi:MAG TPA: RNA methyltransferase, partial [Clostridia bacterium]|nr:RNA methyltransferase [Clostridia bacterium]